MVQDGFWNSIQSWPWANGIPDNAALGPEHANFVAVDENDQIIRNANELGRAVGYKMIDTFGNSPRAGEVSAYKTIADLGAMGPHGKGLQMALEAMAIQNARYLKSGY